MNYINMMSEWANNEEKTIFGINKDTCKGIAWAAAGLTLETAILGTKIFGASKFCTHSINLFSRSLTIKNTGFSLRPPSVREACSLAALVTTLDAVKVLLERFGNPMMDACAENARFYLNK